MKLFEWLWLWNCLNVQSNIINITSYDLSHYHC